MSNSWYLNFLPNSYPRRVSQQQYPPQSSADNGMHASPNDNAGAQYYSYDDSHGISAVSGHSTTRPLQSSIVSMQPEHAWVNPDQAEHNLYLTAGLPHTAQTAVIAQHAHPTRHVPPSTPVTPPVYTDIRDTSIAAPSSMGTCSPSPMHRPPARQRPATSTSYTILGHNPSYAKFRSNGSTRYRCECNYETQRKSDLERHREGSKHAGKKHYCSFHDCNKSFTRRYKLVEHEQTHS